jgi:hypothetical protein
MILGNSANDQLGVLFNFVSEGNRHKTNMLNQALQEYQMGAEFNDDDLRNKAFNKIGDLNKTPLDHLFHMIKGKDRPASHLMNQQELPKRSVSDIYGDTQTQALNSLDAETGDKQFSQYATLLAKDPRFAQLYGENEAQSMLQGYKKFKADQSIAPQHGTLKADTRKLYESELRGMQNRESRDLTNLSEKELIAHDKALTKNAGKDRNEALRDKYTTALERDEEARSQIARREEAKALAKGGEKLRKDYNFSENHDLVKRLDAKGLFRERLEGSESDMRQQNYDIAMEMYDYYKGKPKMQKLIEDRWRRGEESIDGYWKMPVDKKRTLFDRPTGGGQAVKPETFVVRFTGADGKKYEEPLALDQKRINDTKYIEAEIRNQIKDPELQARMLQDARVVAKRSTIASSDDDNVKKSVLQEGNRTLKQGFINKWKANANAAGYGNFDIDYDVEGAVEYDNAMYDVDPVTGVVYKWNKEATKRTRVTDSKTSARIKELKEYEE